MLPIGFTLTFAGDDVMSRKTDASSPSGGIQNATGIYTGDGAATQAIIGVGFQPRHVILWAHEIVVGSDIPLALKADVDGIFSSIYWSGGGTHRYQFDDIISLDADGFTVGDGSDFGFNLLNDNGTVYSYMCFR